MVRFLKFAVVAGAAAVLAYLLLGGPRHSFGGLRAASERKAVAFNLRGLQGGQWSISEQRGKVVLVNFWATWCAPCRMETPGIVNVARRYAGRGVEVVGITMDDTPQRDVPPFVARFGIPYPILLPSDPLASSVESLPTSLLVDRNGRVARTYYGAVDEPTLSRDIDQLLTEHT